MKQVETRQVWKTRVDAYRASGQSASEWCAAQQLTTVNYGTGCGSFPKGCVNVLYAFTGLDIRGRNCYN